MKHIYFLFFSIIAFHLFGQIEKFSSAQCKEDLQFLSSKIQNVHANPYSELSIAQFKDLVQGIDNQLNVADSFSRFDFYKMVLPLFAVLADEHAGINSGNAPEMMNKNYLLPFSLIKKGDKYVIDKVHSSENKSIVGKAITQINGKTIDEILTHCANYTTGFAEKRKNNALKKLPMLYVLAYPYKTAHEITFENQKTLTMKGLTMQEWSNDLTSKQAEKQEAIMSYEKLGDVGFIRSNTFTINDIHPQEEYQKIIDSLFSQIAADNIQTLIIDVSNNGGGNSIVGNMLIDYIYGKSYKEYQCNFKRSDEYVALYKSWGLSDEQYEKIAVGEVLHYDSEVIHPNKKQANRFKGKTYVMVGENTFSSAIMFATIVKDNKIAPLIGQEPEDGHPTHFGEIYNSETPNLHLGFRFGVKEWIRPAGKAVENRLIPDIILDTNTMTHNRFLIERLLQIKQ